MNMSVDFPLILTILVLASGFFALLDVLFFARKRKKSGAKQSIFMEYSVSFFPVLLLVLLIRSFLVQPYRVPTGSLMPTVFPGDFIAVNQFAYGLRLPVLNNKIMNVGEPKIGDIVLFRYPDNPSVIYVKRVIGTPGDHITYWNKVLTVNGKVASQSLVSSTLDISEQPPMPVIEKAENLDGVKHDIYVWPVGGQLQGPFDFTVPKGNYFMMGDNRDNSGDSRDWGYVPEANLIGKAFGIWLSWDSNRHRVRWNRIGKGL